MSHVAFPIVLAAALAAFAAILGRRARLEHLVAVELEVDPAEEPDRGLVVHDEDHRFHRAACHRARSLAGGVPPRRRAAFTI